MGTPLLLGAGTFVSSSYDADAQAYFNANTSITSTADKNAINTFYLGLKSDGIYTKIKAMYLPIWGSAATCKWNLVNPLDTNAAFRLTFATGWTFSSSGMTPNGTSAYADTSLNTAAIGLNSGHYSFYSRTNNTTQAADMGNAKSLPDSYSYLFTYITGALRDYRYNDGTSVTRASGITSTLGMFLTSRTASNVIKGFRNGAIEISGTAASNATSTISFYLGAYNVNGTAAAYSNRQQCFASIGTGLTDTEAANFSSRVNTLMTYFGINVYPSVSDADAQAFVNAAGITDQTQANAVNQLVIDFKAANIWTKMKAIYPIVGGSASSHAVNLKTPGTYNLTFSTGWTHASTGMTPNGTSAYADTFFNTNSYRNNNHISLYIRTNVNETSVDMGNYTIATGGVYFDIESRISNVAYFGNHILSTTLSYAETDSRGFFTNTRTSSTSQKVYKNGFTKVTGTTATTLNINLNLYIGARNSDNSAAFYSTKQCAFASIGDGLTDTEAANFYTRVQNFQTTLGRQV